MTIGGARMIGDVNAVTWERLAGELGFSRRFADSARDEITDRAVSEAHALVEEEAHGNEAARGVLAGMLERSQ